VKIELSLWEMTEMLKLIPELYYSWIYPLTCYLKKKIIHAKLEFLKIKTLEYSTKSHKQNVNPSNPKLYRMV